MLFGVRAGTLYCMDAQSPATATPASQATAGDSVGLARAAALLIGGGAGSAGGLRALEAAFGRVGLDDRFRSWVATGPNLPLSACELQQALGPSVAAIASASGQDPARVAAGLAALLPEVVDRLTSAGQLPPAGRGASLWALARLLFARRARATAP